MEDALELKQEVQSLRHHVRGNGGKGLLVRMDDVEKEVDMIQGNFVEKGECRRNRVEDYRQVEKEFLVIQNALKEMKEERSGDKRMNVVIIGIVVSSLLSAGSLIISAIANLGGV